MGTFDVELGLWDGGRNGLIPEELVQFLSVIANWLEPVLLGHHNLPAELGPD